MNSKLKIAGEHSCNFILICINQLCHYYNIRLIILIAMEDSPIIIKISYKQITQTSGVAVEQCQYENSQFKLNLSTILDQVNQFLIKKSIDKFLHIQIKNQGRWKNITQVFSNSQSTPVISQNNNGKAKIQIRLIELKEQLEESRKITQWSEKLENFMTSQAEIQKKIIRDTLRVEDDDIIDLAFFYAEPIYTQIYHFPDYQPVKTSQVSFLAETRKIEQKLKESNSISRSANIQINVATVKNLQIALSKGVKMLHFSCHGKINLIEKQPQLMIETQDRIKIGIEENLSIKNLINILSEYKKIPEVIIFNACHSWKMAERVHNQFDKRGIHITTVGYIDQIQDVVCEQLAQSFYSNIFNGETIEESFRKCKHIDYHKTRVFYKQTTGVIFKQSKIAEKDKQMYIKNKIQTDIQYNFPREFLFRFIHKQCISPQKGIINLIGAMKVGKTEFARKTMSYLWQRNQMSTFIIIDLREEEYQIANFIQFRCKVENEFRKSGILGNRYQTFIIVIDHCDSVMKYCMKQFTSSIRELSIKIQPNKLIIISCSTFEQYKYNFTINTFSLTKQYKKPPNPNKKKLKSKDTTKPIVQQMFDSQQYEKNCFLIVLNFFKSMEIQFLSQLSIISIFPQQIYSSTDSFPHFDVKHLKQLLQRIHSACPDVIKHIKERILTIKKNSIVLEPQSISSQMVKILKLIYLALGVQFLKFYELGSSTSSLGDQKKQKGHILRTVHSLINICLDVKNKQNKEFSIRIKQMYEVMQIKLYFFTYFIYLRDEQHNKDMLKIIDEFICSIGTNEEYLFKFKLKNLIKVLHICKKFYFISKNNVDININGNEGININLFSDPNMTWYRFRIKEMKNKLAAIHRKMDQRYEHGDQMTYQNYECHLYQATQIDILLLPLLQIIKEEIQKLMKQPHQSNIEQIVSFMEEYKFLDKQGTLFENIFKNYHSLYLQTLFELQKLKLANQKILKRTYNKFVVIQKFNDWIQICRKYNYYWLQKSIEAYKATSFNIFLTMVSFPMNKAYRFQNEIARTMKDTYLELNRQIFLNMETLNARNLKKFKELNVNIPIALFVFDMKKSNDIFRMRRKQSSDEVFVCLENYNNETRSQVQQYDQKFDYVEYCRKQKLSFLKCGVVILCGHGDRQIKNAFVTQNCNARIYIKPRKQRESNEGELKKKIKQVIDGLLFKQIILKFYSVFCQVMYKQTPNSCKNYQEQVNNSYKAAVLSSKIACLNKYGVYYQEEILEILETISLQINENMRNKPMQKLALNTDIFRTESKDLIISPIEKRKKEKKMLIYEIQGNTQIAYSEELMFVLNQIVSYYKIKQKKKEPMGALYFVLVCQFQEQTSFLYNLLIKLKKIANPQIKLESSRINQRRNSDVSEINIDYSCAVTTQKNTVSIMDLTDKHKIDAKKIIESTMFQQNQRQVDHNFEYLRTIIYICKKEIELEKVENLHILRINKFENKNFIPIIAHKVIVRKVLEKNQPKNCKNWEDLFQKTFDKKMQGKFDIFDQRRHYLDDEEYEKKLKKWKQIMEATLKQLLYQII